MIELIGVLMLAITPWLLKAITNLAKSATSIQVPENRTFYLRFLLASLSLAVAVLHANLGGTPVPEDAIEQFVEDLKVFVEAFILWLSTTGLYMLGKKA